MQVTDYGQRLWKLTRIWICIILDGKKKVAVPILPNETKVSVYFFFHLFLLHPKIIIEYTGDSMDTT